MACGPELPKLSDLQEYLTLVSRNLMYHAKPTLAAFVDGAIAEIGALERRNAELTNRLEAAREALEANRVFYTPIALSRKPGRAWDEYEIDAIERTKVALSQLNQPLP